MDTMYQRAWGPLSMVAMVDSWATTAWVEALCLACYASVLFRHTDMAVLRQHIRTCSDLHEATGRGDELRSCGDVEPNPGPPVLGPTGSALPTPMHVKSGRGEGLHTCGDVELNPGPQEQGSDTVAQLATPSNGCALPAVGMQGPFTTLHPLRLLEIQGLRSAALPPLADSPGSQKAAPPGPPGQRALQCSRDVPLLPAPPSAGAPPQDLEVDLAHPEEVPDMVHRVDSLGHSLHIHASRPTVMNVVLPEPLPLKDILAVRCPTIRHVPAVLQQAVTSSLAAAITRYSADPSDANLFLVLGFPKLVLRVTKAKGKFSADAVVASLRHRLAQFQQGNIRALWHDFAEEMGREHQHRPVTRAAKRARSSEKGRIADKVCASDLRELGLFLT